ncbi:MAG: DUF4340 domain-containing protein [Bdellovibrionaceae bacterium]|nr:DUF4340 domain-containing protein [Pseudobdellovibrionaceae bacterium]
MSRKKSNFVGTAVAAALVAGLAGYAYFVEFKQKNAEQEQKDNDALVLRLEQEKLTRIELHRSSGTIVLTSSGGGAEWAIVEPVQDSVDSTQVNALIEGLLGEKSSEVVVEGESIDWKTYGLDQPVTRLVMKAGDRTREVKIGSVKSFDGALYARVAEGGKEENRVLLVSQSWDAHLSKPLIDLRDKRLLKNEDLTYDTLSLQRSGGKRLKLVKKDDKWSVVQGGDPEIPVAGSRVSQFFHRVKGFRATDVVAEDKASAEAKRQGMTSVLTSLDFSQNGKSVWNLSLYPLKGNESESHRLALASDSARVFKVVKAVGEDLDKGAEAFYDMNFPFRVTAADVVDLDVLNSGTRVRAKFENEKWTLADASAKNELDAEKAKELVAALVGLEAFRIRDKSVMPRGIRAGENEIVLRSRSGQVLLNVSWGAPYSEKVDGVETKLVDVRTNLLARTLTVSEATWSALLIQSLLKPKVETKASAPSQAATPVTVGEAKKN